MNRKEALILILTILIALCFSLSFYFSYLSIKEAGNVVESYEEWLIEFYSYSTMIGKYNIFNEIKSLSGIESNVDDIEKIIYPKGFTELSEDYGEITRAKLEEMSDKLYTSANKANNYDLIKKVFFILGLVFCIANVIILFYKRKSIKAVTKIKRRRK